MKKAKTKRQQQFDFLEDTIQHNYVAIKEPPVKKLSIHDLKSIKALNENQRRLITAHFSDQHVIAVGSAGTGKSYLSVYAALNTILRADSVQDKIIIVRSAEPTKQVGFLPGSLDEKLEVYERPYIDIFTDLTGKPTMYEYLKKNNTVQFISTSYLRGLTWNNAVIIFDEVQNASFHEIDSVMTRIGKDSLIIVCGDFKQNDLHAKKNGDSTGYHNFIRVAEKTSAFEIVEFTPNDIVRSGFVKSWIMAKEELNI